MGYPIEKELLKNYYCLHTCKEPEQEISDLLCVVTIIVNQAYEAGVREGMNSKHNK